MILQDAFETFINEVALEGVPGGRVLSAWHRLRPYLIEGFQLDESAVFVHGSHANGTAVKPANATGEYDLDVVAVCAKEGASAAATFARLEDVLAADGDYRGRIERRNPCVRLRYADGNEGRFHIDIVAARDAQAVLAMPFRQEGAFRLTNPAGYTRWCLDRGPHFSRTVRVMKRWRDVNQDKRRGIKSIVLQVLAGNALEGVESSDAEALVTAFCGIQRRLNAHPSKIPTIVNPSLPSQDLAEGWPFDHYLHFRREVDAAVVTGQAAVGATSRHEAHRLWRELLGESFPGSPDRDGGGGVPPPMPPGFGKAQEPPRGERYG